MTNTLIIEKAIEEIETKNFDTTKQFLEIHKIAYIDNKPKIASVDIDKKDEAIVYFNVEGEKFYFAIYVDLKPLVSVRWTNTEPYHSVYFIALSDKFSANELSTLTKLTPTQAINKGDKKNSNVEKACWKESVIVFEPNPEADEFEDKLTKLLDYLEQDKEGLEKLVNHANCHIQVHSSFHNGNTMIGGYHIQKNHIKRMSKLNLDIDFDFYADGHFFK